MTTLNLELPEEVFSALRRSPEEFRPRAAARGSHPLVSTQSDLTGEGCAGSGLDSTDFLMALAREGMAALVVDLNDLRCELERG